MHAWSFRFRVPSRYVNMQAPLDFKNDGLITLHRIFPTYKSTSTFLIHPSLNLAKIITYSTAHAHSWTSSCLVLPCDAAPANSFPHRIRSIHHRLSIQKGMKMSCNGHI